MLDTILFSPCLARIDERASKLRIPAESFANKAAAERVPEIGYRHHGSVARTEEIFALGRLAAQFCSSYEPEWK